MNIKKGSWGLTTSISVLEWPMLQTMQPFFMRSRFSRTTTFLLPDRGGVNATEARIKLVIHLVTALYKKKKSDGYPCR